MRSALYRGHVEHVRRTPRVHRFRSAVHFLYVDLDELPRVFRGRWFWSLERWNWASFRRSDYLGPASRPLDEAVRDRVEEALGRRPRGSVGILTQLRTFGYLFNPVSFYYCHDEEGRLDAVVAEITNTPWSERHAYVLDARSTPADASAAPPAEPGRGQPPWAFSRRFEKAFHVSPFFDLDQLYEWRFSSPGERVGILMTNLEGGDPVFHASLTARRQPISTWSLAVALLRYPVQPLRVHLSIYWNAALLYLKRTPFFAHPSKRPSAREAPTS